MHIKALVLLCGLAVSCAPPVTIDVSVSEGPRPEISFDGGGVSTLQVYDMPGEDVEPFCAPLGDGVSPRYFWSIRAAGNGLSSPIAYGLLPNDAIADQDETRPLIAGSAVCVAVIRTNDSGYPAEMGTAVFTP